MKVFNHLVCLSPAAEYSKMAAEFKRTGLLPTPDEDSDDEDGFAVPVPFVGRKSLACAARSSLVQKPAISVTPTIGDKRKPSRWMRSPWSNGYTYRGLIDWLTHYSIWIVFDKLGNSSLFRMLGLREIVERGMRRSVPSQTMGIGLASCYLGASFSFSPNSYNVPCFFQLN